MIIDKDFEYVFYIFWVYILVSPLFILFLLFPTVIITITVTA